MANLDRIEVKLADWTDKDGMELRGETTKRGRYRRDYRAEPGLPPSAEDVPVFLILKLDDQPIACGGLRPLLPSEGDLTREVEIKRMYMVPEYRGKEHGIADFLMKQLESQALERGWNTLKLETAADMDQAKRFYQRHGFKEIPLFGHYKDAWNSVCYEKTLTN
jgi:GNAT superfamily N-acetyltransferase